MSKGCMHTFVVLASGLLVGCTGVDSNFCRVRDLVVQSTGAQEVVTEFQLGLGRGVLWLGETVVRLAPGDDPAAALLLDIHAVQVGVYRLHGERKDTRALPAMLVRRLAKRGYEPIVKVSRKGEATLILAQMSKERLKAIFFIAVDGQELVLAEVRGRLERVVEEAVRRRDMPAKKAAFLSAARQPS